MLLLTSHTLSFEDLEEIPFPCKLGTWPCISGELLDTFSKPGKSHAKWNLTVIMSGPRKSQALSDGTFPITLSLAPE